MHHTIDNWRTARSRSPKELIKYSLSKSSLKASKGLGSSYEGDSQIELKDFMDISEEQV